MIEHILPAIIVASGLVLMIKGLRIMRNTRIAQKRFDTEAETGWMLFEAAIRQAADFQKRLDEVREEVEGGNSGSQSRQVLA